MLLNFMKGKIHRATVTEADLDYEGSILVDSTLLKEAGIYPYEQVDVYNVTNGERITTYAIAGKADSGVICSNGAAAHQIRRGDKVIIVAYARVSEVDVERLHPRAVLVDAENRIVETRRGSTKL